MRQYKFSAEQHSILCSENKFFLKENKEELLVASPSINNSSLSYIVNSSAVISLNSLLSLLLYDVNIHIRHIHIAFYVNIYIAFQKIILLN